MGGRGTYASGKKVIDTFEAVDTIAGVKVLRTKNGRYRLPEESKTAKAYILLDKNGVFRQYRKYDKNHRAILDIDYHAEPGSKGKLLHVHLYAEPDVINRRRGRRIIIRRGDKWYNKYKKFFKGVKL